ncbi:MAG: Dedicator of cytokinesis protein 2, partial [Paramarteilia canceri]
MYCEIISSGIRNVISMLYDLSNQNSNKIEALDSKNSETYRLRDIFISIILLLEILVDQGIQIKEMLVYVNKIMEKLVQLNNSKYLSIFVEIVVGSVIFDDRESRVILLEGIVHLITISRTNEKSVEEDESGKNSIVTRHKHVKINFELLASILSRISVDEETLSKTKELALIKTATLDATLDFICYDSHKNSIDSDASSRFAEISMLILFSLADKKTMSDWYSQHDKKSKKKQFTYMVLKSVRNIFKKSSDLITSQVEYFGETVELTTYLLELISEEIFKYFLMPFEIGIFKQFIDTCTRIVSSSMFKRMHQTSQQMQIFRALYPNCHLNISIMVRKMLEKLTASYISNEETISILKEAISFALVEHSSERTKLIKLILKIWNSHIHNTENFELISKIIMDQIFISISGGFGTVNSCHALADIINSCSSSNASFYEDFNINLKKMIPTLLEHRSITNSKGLDSQKLSLYKLYLNLSERNEIEKSISVLKKMYKIEDNSGNSSVEKGFMLYHYLQNLKKLDVKQFSESMLLSFLKDTMNKSEIYKIICQNSIKIFNKNFIPRMTVNMCLSIIPELENESNYSEISDLYSNISEAYKIIKSNFDTFSQAERKFSFFRMEFFGKSIPSILCDQIFVFRGEEKVDVESLITYFSVTFQVSNFVYKSESIDDAKKKYLPHSS